MSIARDSRENRATTEGCRHGEAERHRMDAEHKTLTSKIKKDHKEVHGLS